MSLRWVRTRGSRPAPDRRAPAASIRGHAGEFAISAARPAVTRAALLGSVWLGSLAMLAPNLAHAQDATWTGSASGNWSDNFNWAPAVPAGTATFDNTALTTSLTFSSFTEIGTLQFATTGPAYFYDLSGRALVIGGAGILNSSSSAPTFNAFGLLEFDNAATAGNAIINNTPGATTFTGTSTAGTATTRTPLAACCRSPTAARPAVRRSPRTPAPRRASPPTAPPAMRPLSRTAARSRNSSTTAPPPMRPSATTGSSISSTPAPPATLPSPTSRPATL
jgi:hypothetical protein